MTGTARSRSTFTTLVLGATGAAGAVAALATLGGLSGGLWWPLDLLSSFHPQYLVVLAAAALVHLALRSPASGVWLLAAALINAAIVAPLFLGSGADPDAAGERLTVVSFNVGVSNPARDDIARYLAAEEPGLLFVIESSFEWEDALERQGPPLATLAIVPRGRVSGITVMADPSLGARVIPAGFADPGEAIAVEATLGGERLTVLGLHPPSPTNGERAARRDEVMAAAAEWVRGVEGPVLVIGDLNATPWSSAYRSFRWTAMLADTSHGSGFQPSWPAGWGPAMIPIDHALHSGGLVLVERRTGPSFGSAHRPLLVTVAAAG
ncbi:MAG: endonuclease/exonuclease/phosphatase family protein [Actinobacteria bacterium]|nr:endonuclease/exonuclease/phosphatase family protein [Actinomycetota bacterium]